MILSSTSGTVPGTTQLFTEYLYLMNKSLMKYAPLLLPPYFPGSLCSALEIHFVAKPAMVTVSWFLSSFLRVSRLTSFLKLTFFHRRKINWIPLFHTCFLTTTWCHPESINVQNKDPLLCRTYMLSLL